MEENQEEANVLEGPDNLATDDQGEQPETADPAKKAKDKKDQPDNERPSEDNANPAPHKDEQPERISNIGDVIGGNGDINLQQDVKTNFFIFQAPDGNIGSLETIIEKYASNGNPLQKAYSDIYQKDRYNTKLKDEDIGDDGTEIKPLELDDEIVEWYCEKLSEWEVCFVQVAAVLHGIPFYMIRDIADTLYHPPIASTEEVHISRTAARISEKTLRTHLRMKIVFTSGADRLFWYDTNTNGVSTFAARLLPIIIRQSNLSATNRSGQSFLQHVEYWSNTLEGESAWRANRALGSIWIKLDEDRFLSILNKWVTSDNLDDWRRAATLLDGAYEVEYAKQGEQTNEEGNSFVLSRLARWTRHAHASFQISFGSTVAQAYGRIGQRSLTPALTGLETLLRYPLRHKNDTDVQMPLLVFVPATWSYVSLARFGSVRDVLQHIALIIEKCCYHRRSPQGSERQKYRAQCRFMLFAMFNTFFLIASASLNGARDKGYGNYKRDIKLPIHPLLPGDDGQDVLLASILSSEETALRQNIMNILCGAILEKEADAAFYLLKRWAEILLKEPSPHRLILRNAFLDFLVELADKGNLWCTLLVSVDEYDAYPDEFALLYKEALQQWRIKRSDVLSQSLSAFAKDVLRHLHI